MTWSAGPGSFCEDGTIAPGTPTFVPSADGMECQLPSVHCLTADADACEITDDCEGGTLVEQLAFGDGEDGRDCIAPEVHCVTDDSSGCPQLSPLPPTFCEDGTIAPVNR